MDQHHDYLAIRKEYEDNGIDEAQLPSHPMTLFRQWYQEACDCQPESWFEPNAMALATSDSAGRVTNRIVLLKGVVEEGIQFFTNYDSQKGQQVSQNPCVAAMFHWPYLGRQIRLEGRVEKTTREVSEKYFHSRPRGSQISAAISPQSKLVSSRAELVELGRELDQQHRGKPIPLPANWGGYLLKVDHYEFWQGRPDRCHDRVVYELEAGESEKWVRLRLAP